MGVSGWARDGGAARARVVLELGQGRQHPPPHPPFSFSHLEPGCTARTTAPSDQSPILTPRPHGSPPPWFCCRTQARTIRDRAIDLFGLDRDRAKLRIRTWKEQMVDAVRRAPNHSTAKKRQPPRTQRRTHHQHHLTGSTMTNLKTTLRPCHSACFASLCTSPSCYAHTQRPPPLPPSPLPVVLQRRRFRLRPRLLSRRLRPARPLARACRRHPPAPDGLRLAVLPRLHRRNRSGHRRRADATIALDTSRCRQTADATVA